MQQRYYDPIAGRFLSVDPVVTDAETGDLFGRYVYADNNPYLYVDPDGRAPGDMRLPDYPQSPTILPLPAPMPVPVITPIGPVIMPLPAPVPITTPAPTPVKLEDVVVEGKKAAAVTVILLIRPPHALDMLKVLLSSPGKREVQQTSPHGEFWKGLKPYRGKTKTNGLSGGKKRFYEWDHTHGDVEQYDSQGRHLGSVNAETGDQTKDAVPGRKIDL